MRCLQCVIRAQLHHYDKKTQVCIKPRHVGSNYLNYLFLKVAAVKSTINAIE